MSLAKIGKKFSDEHRAKMSLARMGHHPSEETRAKMSVAARSVSIETKAKRSTALCGHVTSAETREKISAAQRGRPRVVSHLHTPEVRAKIGVAMRGRKLTALHIARLSAAHIGKPGHAWSSEARKKNAAAHRGKVLSSEHRAKLSVAHIGQKPSIESREKRLISLKKSWIERRAKWNALSAEERQAKMAKLMHAARRTHKMTSLERTVAAVLDALEVKYRSQYTIGPYVADFFVPSRGLVIEADGAYWHNRPEVTKRDLIRDKALVALGYRVVRLPEALIKSGAANVLREAVA